MRKIGLLLFVIANTTFATTAPSFNYQQQPINPACVAMFNGSEADLPYISAINIATCQHSNAAYQKAYTSADNTIYFYKNNQDDRDGQYGYQLIGKTNNGIYVLLTKNSTGGTGVFADLLLLRILSGKNYFYDLQSNGTKLLTKKTTELKYIGDINIGNHCQGISSAKVAGNKLILTVYHGKNSSDCSQAQTKLLDLTDY